MHVCNALTLFKLHNQWSVLAAAPNMNNGAVKNDALWTVAHLDACKIDSVAKISFMTTFKRF